MTVMLISVKVRPGKEREFMQLMDSLLCDHEQIKGLKTSKLYQEVEDPNGFQVILEWETQEESERFLDTARFGVLAGAARVLCEKSEVSYGGVLRNLQNIQM